VSGHRAVTSLIMGLPISRFRWRRKHFRSRVPCGFGRWCREGELNPQGTKYRRILRASKWTTFHCFELLLSASDAVSANIELLPIPSQMC